MAAGDLGLLAMGMCGKIGREGERLCLGVERLLVIRIFLGELVSWELIEIWRLGGKRLGEGL